MTQRRVQLAIYFEGNPVPMRIDGVRVAGIEPDQVHVWLERQHAGQVIDALTNIAAARATRSAAAGLAKAIAEGIGGLAKRRRGGRLHR